MHTRTLTHAPVEELPFHDDFLDRETARLQKFGKLLAGPNTDLGMKGCGHINRGGGRGVEDICP